MLELLAEEKLNNVLGREIERRVITFDQVILDGTSGMHDQKGAPLGHQPSQFATRGP